MSLSSPNNLGSINTFFASLRPFEMTFTMPAPDSPVTSISASSACAFCMFSCICCAWRIKFPNPPFIIKGSSLVRWFDRPDVHVGAEALAQSFDGRIRLERTCRTRNSVLLRLDPLPGGGVQICCGYFERYPHIASQILGQALHELFLEGARAPVRCRLVEPQGEQVVLETGRHAIQHQLAHHAAQRCGL